MAYTFGGNTGDDVAVSTGLNFGATATAGLICGWFYPTTLTAGRGYWSFGNVVGAKVHTTTSEIGLATDNTTDGAWSTSGAGIAVNNWYFLAVFGTFSNTGPAAAWRVWLGTGEVAPAELTVTQNTAPVGNFVGTNAMAIGNLGTGTTAFQGDIDKLSLIQTTATAGATAPPFCSAAYGACTQAEADWIEEMYVLPIWTGDVALAFSRVKSLSANVEVNHIDLAGIDGTRTFYTSSTTPNGNRAITVNTAVLAATRCPRATPGVPFQVSMARR